MCGSYTLIAGQGEIEGAFDIKMDRFDWLRHFPRYNITPTHGVLMNGWLIHYNFFRPQLGLGGKTPAQAAGILYFVKTPIELVKAGGI